MNETLGDIDSNDHVRFVLISPDLENPIAIPIQSVTVINTVKNRDDCEIQDALHGGEFHVRGGGGFVDGYCAETNTIYEFLLLARVQKMLRSYNIQSRFGQVYGCAVSRNGEKK